jgi:hypothetical protein
MKCATETMGTIIRRFGYKRALNFVLSVKNNIYLGWPYIMMKTDHRPSKWVKLADGTSPISAILK